MRQTLSLLLAAAIGSAVPATLPTQSQDRTVRAGMYDLSVTFGGGLLDATLEIAYRGDTLTAVLKLGDHESPVRAGKRSGTKLELVPTSPSMDVRYDLEFNADEVKGTFRYQGQEGDVKGKRRQPGH